MAPPLSINKVAGSIVSLHRHANRHTDHLPHTLDDMPTSSSPPTPFFMSLYHSSPASATLYHSSPTSATIRLATDEDGPAPSSTPVLSSSASTTSTASSYYSSTHSSLDEEHSILPHEHFYSHLQTNTSLLRIVLRRSLPATLMAEQWHQLKLEVRDEFGMTLEGQRAKTSTMHLTCELLEQQTTGPNHAVYLSTDWKVDFRPLHYDAWESMENGSHSLACSGFDRSGNGGLEFIITYHQKSLNSSISGHSDIDLNSSTLCSPVDIVPPTTPATHFYLRLVPTFEPQQTINALPLVVGPFSVMSDANWKETTIATLTASPTTTTTTAVAAAAVTTAVTAAATDHHMFKEEHTQEIIVNTSPQLFNLNCYSQNMYRTFNVDGTNQYFMIKEGWDLGTPGKMWDSALMISDLFTQKIMQHPTCLENCHLLDLSAGTGATGLLIYFIYKHNFPEHHHNIKITLTDLPDALPLIHYNQQLNGIATTPNISVTPLRWGKLKDIWRIKKKEPIDIIIASDVLYEPTQFAALMKTLVHLAEPGRTIIYLGYKRRGLKESDEQYFFDLCCDAFDMQAVGFDNGDDDEAAAVEMNGDNRNGDDNDMKLGAGLDGCENGSTARRGTTNNNNKQSKVGWEKRCGMLVRNETRMNGEGWLGSYAKKWQADTRDNNKNNNSNNNNGTSSQGFEETGVQIYRLVRKMPSQ